MAKHTRSNGPSLDNFDKPKKSRKVIVRRIIIAFLAVLLVGAGSAFAYYKFIEGKMQPKGLMAKAIAAVISKPVPQEPVNFLVMGADATEEDPKGRADTLFIVRVNFQKKQATMINIPRDFYVDIPGYKKDKINHSYNYGGPAKTIETVQEYTGLPIHHYVVVDYQGFVNIVNALGGVTVNVKERMVDDELGDPLDPGVQKLDGGQALFYVRFRNAPTGDFTRIADQQNFARSLIDESARIQNAFKIPALINILTSNIKTDMSLAQMLDFANEARSFKQDNLTTVMLPGVPGDIDGVSYVMPTQDKVDLILDAIRNNKPIDPLLLEDVDPSEVTVKVLNGGTTEGVGSEIADILANKGYNIASIGNADKNDYSKTVIFYSKPNYAKALKVKSDLKGDLPDIQLTESSTIDPTVTVIVIVGKDYK
jgi:polyisoprenyl-teichoic acid--peptidoglycan teichoic acid transferase